MKTASTPLPSIYLFFLLFAITSSLQSQKIEVIPLNLPNHKYGETEREKEIFPEITKHIKILEDNGKILKDSAMQAYVEGILAKVIPKELESFEIKTYIIKDHSINAGMYPNGIMVIHTGLISILNSEAELAFIISHELAHFIYRHSLLGYYHDDELIEKYNKKRRKKEEEEDELNKKIWEYSRFIEEAADSLGMMMYMATDYKTVGAKKSLEALPLPEYFVIKFEGALSILMDDIDYSPMPTHPKNEDRIAFIKSIKILKEGNYLGEEIHKPHAIKAAKVNMEILKKQGADFYLLTYLDGVQETISDSSSVLFQEILITKAELYYDILETPYISGYQLYYEEQKAKNEDIVLNLKSNKKSKAIFEREKPVLEKKAFKILFDLLDNEDIAYRAHRVLGLFYINMNEKEKAKKHLNLYLNAGKKITDKRFIKYLLSEL